MTLQPDTARLAPPLRAAGDRSGGRASSRSKWRSMRSRRRRRVRACGARSGGAAGRAGPHARAAAAGPSACWGHLFVIATVRHLDPVPAAGRGRRASPPCWRGSGTRPRRCSRCGSDVHAPRRAPDAPPRRRVAAGFAGVLIVLGPWRSVGGGERPGQLMCLGAAACYGIAFPYTRRFVAGRPDSGMSLSAGQLIWSSVSSAWRPRSSVARRPVCRSTRCWRCWRSACSAPAWRTSSTTRLCESPERRRVDGHLPRAARVDRARHSRAGRGAALEPARGSGVVLARWRTRRG